MPSMSYCRFHNTAIEMSYCVSDLEDAYTISELDHDESEKKARDRLYDLAQEYIIQYDRLINAEEFEEDFE